MIPYAILNGTVFLSDNTKIDIRILDLSIDSFTFRLPVNVPSPDPNAEIYLNYYQYQAAAYQKITLHSYHLEKESQTSYETIYRIICSEPLFLSCTSLLMKEYQEYIQLKLSGDDTRMSEQLTGYPGQSETIFASSWKEQKKELFEQARKNLEESSDHSLRSYFPITTPEFALELGTKDLQKSFLKNDLSEFLDWFWKIQHLDWHPFRQLPIKTIYIGSQYCIHRFPEEQFLFPLLERILSQGMIPVITLPPVKEREFSFFQDLFTDLKEWTKENHSFFPDGKLEIIINDWGMAAWLADTAANCFSLSLGVLMNKRKKDPRLPYKNGYEMQMNFLQRNTTNAPFYQKYLKEKFGIQNYSYESCSYHFSPADGSHILHLPFYQINTSGHCTLFAACTYGDRGKQHATKNCPQYCRQSVFLYPKMLSMIGLGNSLFGYDTRILWDVSYFRSICGSNIKRIVLSLP